MQFLPRRSYARVNRLRFQPDFSAIIAATSQEFRTCSKLDEILRRFVTILNHKRPLGRFCYAGFHFLFVWLWLIRTKKTCIRLCLRLRRALGTVLAGYTNRQQQQQSRPQYSCLFTGTFSELLVKANQRNPN